MNEERGRAVQAGTPMTATREAPAIRLVAGVISQTLAAARMARMLSP